MPKLLLVMRHAKSSWADDDLADHERPLTSRGKADAARIGRELARRGLLPDVVVCSMAKRARSTAKRVIAELPGGATRMNDERLYDSSPRQCLEVLSEQGDSDTVLIVGHNPTFEDLVELLTARPVSLPTATVVIISLPVDDWQTSLLEVQGSLREMIVARDLRGE